MHGKLQLVGVLNVTPDSFSDGGANLDPSAALASAKKLLDDGASVIDVGAESTNPRSTPLSPSEEQARLKNILPELLKHYPNQVSLDTYHHETVAWALQFGRPIINDITALYSLKMAQLVAGHNLTCIISHLPPGAKGVPTRAHTATLTDDINRVVSELKSRIQLLQELGIKQEQMIIDPGLGFGKTMKLNWQLLRFAEVMPDYPVMVGHSKKRFLGCDETTGEPLKNGQELRFTPERNRYAAEIAAQAGAAYLRVHEPDWYKGLGW